MSVLYSNFKMSSRTRTILKMAVHNTKEESDRIQNRLIINCEIQECDVPVLVHEEVITGKPFFHAEYHPVCQPNSNNLMPIDYETEVILSPAIRTQEKQTLFPDNTQQTQMPTLVWQEEDLGNYNSDTDSIPDSQPDFVLSCLSDDEKRFELKSSSKRIKIVPPSDSSNCSSSYRDSSDSNKNSSTLSSSSDFSSDDSIKDPEFLPERNIQKKRINYQFFSPQPGPSWAEDDPNEMEIQPSNTDIETPSINIQPSSIDSLVTVPSSSL